MIILPSFNGFFTDISFLLTSYYGESQEILQEISKDFRKYLKSKLSLLNCHSAQAVEEVVHIGDVGDHGTLQQEDNLDLL